MSHKVNFNIPERRVGNVPVEFRVVRNNEVLGRLRVHKDRIVWLPKNSKKGRDISWKKFDEFMESHGTPEP